MRKVVRRVEEMRDERYSLLRGYFHGADDADDDDHEQVRLQSVPVDARADAVGRSLEELGLYVLGIEVTAIRRHGIRGVEPDPQTKLRAATSSCCAGCPRRSRSPRSGCRGCGASRRPG
jgi:CPA2 family monovalent cation:H+ antiporter-2